MTRQIIITCAVTGAGDTVRKNPAVPVTPAEIAQSAVDAANAGAAVVHLHVRDPMTTKPSMELDLYRQTVERIRASGVDVLLNLTTGPGQRFEVDERDPKSGGPRTTLSSPENRVRHVVELRPELCSLDVATMVSGSAYGETVVINTPAHLKRMGIAIKESGTKPELEVFDLGGIRLARDLLERGVIESPPFFQLCLGVEWGAPCELRVMQCMIDQLPAGTEWAAFGIGRDQFRMVALSAAAGGHVRVGLEDNLYLDRGNLAPSNAAQVERAAQIVQLVGAKVASPAEAREMLNLRSSSSPARS